MAILKSGSTVGGKPIAVIYVQSATPPIVAGDQWFDNTVGVNRWKYCDGTSWIDPLKYQ